MTENNPEPETHVHHDHVSHHHEEHAAAAHHAEHHEAHQEKKKLLNRNNVLFGLAILIILLTTVLVRLPLIGYQGFYEPDGFYHFSVIRAAVNNDFRVPNFLGISGWPGHAPVTEPDGLYWVTLVPYFFLQFLGISYYDIIRLIPLLFGIFDVLGAWLLARFVSKDKLFAIIVMALVALSSGNAARTSALIYRGDTFSPIFLIFSLVFLGLLINEPQKNKKILFAVLSGLFLSLSAIVWNGASYGVIIYLLALVMMLVYAFILSKKQLLKDMGYAVGAIMLWFILVNIYTLAGFMPVQSLAGLPFLAMLVIVAIAWFVSMHLDEKPHLLSSMMRSPPRRLILTIIFIIIASVAVLLFSSQLIYNIFVGNGFITTGNAFASTIQELTPPTFDFLFASFGIALFMTPMSIIMTLSSIYQGQTVLLWILSLFLFIPYLFMQVFDARDWLEGKAKFLLDIKPQMLILISYFAITMYLEMFAIRFNSLVSIPLAIFAAYTIYWLLLALRQLAGQRFRLVVLIIACLVVLSLLIVVFYYDTLYGAGVVQADSINPLFLNATLWLKNNTPANSVVLTLWPDGSVVEGWGNRTSVTDSVGSQNASKADPFALWLFNSSDEPQFLTSSINGRPNYLLVRNVWLQESSGIYTESGINSSLEPEYGFCILPQIGEQINATEKSFRFLGACGGSGSLDSYLYLGANSVSAFVQEGAGISPFKYVTFLNESNGQYNIVNDSLQYNQTNGQTLAVFYSGVPNPSLPINVTGAFIYASNLASSNLLKLLYYCNAQQCAWDNNQASLNLIFANGDTKIFQIIYNTTS